MTNYNTLFIGIDIDDKAFHIGAVSQEDNQTFQTKCKPTLGSLLKVLERYQEKEYKLKICYEASYIGYSLCRDLRAANYECEIIAPSLIPQVKGKKVKTDKIDALNLAKYFLKGDLTPIYIPNGEDEEIRDFIRLRAFTVKERGKFKKHLLSLCRRYRINYKDTGVNVNYWTNLHLSWLNKKIKELSNNAQTIFNSLMGTIETLDQSVSSYDEQIEIFSKLDRYIKKVEALSCFRGLDILSSMILVVEIGDIKRFSHPKKLSSYCGLDIIEYSSGGKEKKFGITKMGNKNIRTVLVEACQLAKLQFRISKRLKKSRLNKPKKIISIADKCMRRLHEKTNRLLRNGKEPNKVKVAAAREMGGFIWAALKEVV